MLSMSASLSIMFSLFSSISSYWFSSTSVSVVFSILRPDDCKNLLIISIYNIVNKNFLLGTDIYIKGINK
jgi:hypothetical protein